MNFLTWLNEPDEDTEWLPEWARRDDAVIWLATRNLSFRCNVFEAETNGYRRALARKARRIYEGEHDGE